MAPPFLTGNVSYQQDVGVVDVQTIIDNLTTLALALTPPWTNPVAGQLVSPVDASGRQMTLQFNRIAATNLELVATDGQGRSSTRRAQINAAGSSVNYYVGQFHMMLEWLNGATPEGLYAIMLDESPELETSHDMWLVMNGARTTGNALDGNWVFGNTFVIRSANAFAVLANALLIPIYNGAGGTGDTGYVSRTLGGSNIWCPIIQIGDTTAGVMKIYGKWYQCLTTKDSFNPVGSEVSVPVDQANSSIFRVTSMPAFATAGGTDRVAVRKT